MQPGKARHEKAMAYIAVRNIFHNFALNERRQSATNTLAETPQVYSPNII